MDPKPRPFQMRLKGLSRLVILLIALIVTTASITQAQSVTVTNSSLKNRPSPTTAMRYSLFGTLLPVTAGILFWSFDGPETIIVSGPNGSNISFNGSEPSRVAPVLLIWSGVTLGPSMGYFYGNKSGRGLGGFALRNGVMIGGTAAAFAICPNFNCQEENLAALVFLGSMGFVLASSIYDIANVGKSVRKENTKRETKSLSVRPMLSNGFRPSGIALTLRF